MTTTLMPTPKQQYFDNNGAPLDGGKIYTYSAGTSTPKATYTDSAGTVAQPNPIPLNARGEPASPVFWSGSYKVVVKDASGTTVYTVDNYNTDPAGLWSIFTAFLSSTGASLIGWIQSGANAVLTTVMAKLRLTVDVEDFGALANGSDDSAAFTLAFTRSKRVQCNPDSAYSLANVTIPDGCHLYARGATFRKNANGYIFSMGKRTAIHGDGAVFDGTSGSKTGNSIVVAVGDNTTNYTNQGHQLIEDCTFTSSDQYHVAYTAANKGWMSRILNCRFMDMPTNSPAMVLWPDEAALGGNRYIIGGYSAGPVVNANGCDNGIVENVTIGAKSVPDTNEGVYFAPSTTNPAKKVLILGNRLAYGGGRMSVRGQEHQVKNNMCAGDIYLMNGANACSIGGNNFAAGCQFVDQSLAVNYVYGQQIITGNLGIISGVTLGNGTLTYEFARDGDYVNFFATFVIGSTTSITGTMIFALPFPVYSGNTNRCLGNAWGDSYVGTLFIETGAQQITIYNNASRAVWSNTVPKSWVTGDTIRMQGRYRI